MSYPSHYSSHYLLVKLLVKALLNSSSRGGAESRRGHNLMTRGWI